MKILKHLRSDWFRYGFETIAVVVGILVAFSLDNWNDTRKIKNEEIKVLGEISIALKTDVEKLKMHIDEVEILKNRIEKLLTILKQKEKGSVDSIDILFGAVYGLMGFELNMAPFEAFRSKGLETISDDTIRYLIIQIYEVGQNDIQNMNVIQRNVNYEVLRPYYMNNFSNIRFNSSATPLSLNHIREDNYYFNIAEYKMSVLSILIEDRAAVLTDMAQLIKILDH